MINVEPGVYEGVSFETYCQWDAVNSSRLKLVERSPAHYLLNRDFDSEALLFGRLVHCGKLEVESLPKRYAVQPPYHTDEENKTKAGEQTQSKSTKYYKTKVKEFRQWAGARGLEVVEQHDYNAMLAMLKAITANDRAEQWFNSEGQTEVSIVWEDKETGLLCKARFDKLMPDGFVDLKTCRDVMKFERAMYDYGYHLQAAFYLDGYRTAFECDGVARFVAIENTRQPYGVMAAPIDPDSLALGQETYRHYLRTVAACKKSNDWPGYRNPDFFGVPHFIINREMDLRAPTDLTFEDVMA